LIAELDAQADEDWIAGDEAAGAPPHEFPRDSREEHHRCGNLPLGELR
jgi:hypothetical protein